MKQRIGSSHGFSLIEVAIALGIFSFAVVAVIGLFAVSLRTSRESEDEIRAASIASMLIETRKAAPRASLGRFALSTNALTQPYGPAFPGGETNYISMDGQLSAPSSAAYRIICQSGTNAITGVGVAQVYIMLSWPPLAAVNAGQAGRYEIIAQIPNR